MLRILASLAIAATTVVATSDVSACGTAGIFSGPGPGGVWERPARASAAHPPSFGPMQMTVSEDGGPRFSFLEPEGEVANAARSFFYLANELLALPFRSILRRPDR